MDNFLLEVLVLILKSLATLETKALSKKETRFYLFKNKRRRDRIHIIRSLSCTHICTELQIATNYVLQIAHFSKINTLYMYFIKLFVC